MSDLYYWPTPNGHKITLYLEKTDLPYRLLPVDIGKGAQFAPEFLRISPNNKSPAIVDHEPAGGGEPLALCFARCALRRLPIPSSGIRPCELRSPQHSIVRRLPAAFHGRIRRAFDGRAIEP